MDIFETQENELSIISIKGRIDSNTAPKFLETLQAINTRGIFTLILDLRDVVYVSSAGLRVLIDILKTCKKSNQGDLILANVPQRIKETLELAGFSPLFRFFPDVQTAIEQYKA